MVDAETQMCRISGFNASGVLNDEQVRDVFCRLPAPHTAIRTLSSIRYEDRIKEDVNPKARRISAYQVLVSGS